jgi:hypothetical protein
MADLLGVVLGTGILWRLKIFGTYPLAKHMVKKNSQPGTTGANMQVTKKIPPDPDAKYCSECGTAIDAEADFLYKLRV